MDHSKLTVKRDRPICDQSRLVLKTLFKKMRSYGVFEPHNVAK